MLPDSWNQPQVTDASHFVVLTARTDLTMADIDAWISRMAEVQNKGTGGRRAAQRHDRRFRRADERARPPRWNIRQVYIALGQLMAAAAVLGIDACPMEGISAAAYDRILGLEDSGYATVVACALGYRAAR